MNRETQEQTRIQLGAGDRKRKAVSRELGERAAREATGLTKRNGGCCARQRPELEQKPAYAPTKNDDRAYLLSGRTRASMIRPAALIANQPTPVSQMFFHAFVYPRHQEEGFINLLHESPTRGTQDQRRSKSPLCMPNLNILARVLNNKAGTGGTCFGATDGHMWSPLYVQR